MINNHSVIAIITARGGSKGLKNKNILPLAGKPLIAWTIDQAKNSKYIDKTVISTEDQNIAKICKKFGGDVPFLRPRELARDNTKIISVILNVLENIKDDFSILVLLQPTSPLRLSSDIDSCLDLMVRKKAPSCISICKSAKPIDWHFKLSEGGKIRKVFPKNILSTNRQDFAKSYIPNGAIYAAHSKWLKLNNSFFHNATLGYEMPQERSIDIDDKIDFGFAEFLMQNSY